MNVLSISADRRLANPESDASRRQEAYRKELGGLTVLVLGTTGRIVRHAVALHRQHPFTAVTSQDAFRTGFIAWRISRRLRIPWVAQAHTDVTSPAFQRQSWKTFAHWLVARFLLPRAHAIRAVSERAARGIRRWVGDRVPVTVLPLAWRPEHIGTHARPVVPTVLMASRLTAEKRIGDGLEAFARVRKHVPDARLMIAGDGPLRPQREALAAELGIADAVSFLGWRDDVPRLMQGASVFVLCSAFEGYGTVIAEALAAGCPVVMTDVGNAGELVKDDVSGLVVAVGDVHALADGIIRILRDAELAGRLSEGGTGAIRFLPTFDEYVKRYAALFEIPPSAPRVLFLTQAVDESDSVLGFVCRWLTALAGRSERVTVVCLRKGRHSLPRNVRVLTLGKERRTSRVRYVLNFYRHIWSARRDYDTVFVHMNQVYVLLGWPLWRMLGKRIILWRNHPYGTLATRLAVTLSDHVLCTSERSFTARFAKTRIMPVGIDTELFFPGTKPRGDRVIAYVGRIGPIKQVDMLVEALGILRSRDVAFTARIVGDALPQDEAYAQGLRARVRELGYADAVKWEPGVPVRSLPAVYRAATIIVNLTPPGSFDKVILEALACGTPVITANTDLRGHVDGRCLVDPADATTVAGRLEGFLELPETERAAIGEAGREYVVREHSLKALMDRLLPML